MSELIANSNGQKLEDHSRMVGKVAREMGRRCGLYSQDSIRTAHGVKIADVVEVLGWAHDLGKATRYFQKNLQGVGNLYEETSIKDRPLHHEISWAYLADRFDETSHHKWILNAVYWHHSRPVALDGDFFKSKDEILSKLLPSELREIHSFAERFNWSLGFREDSTPFGDITAPNLFTQDGGGNSDENAIMHTLRSLLIAADRLVSSLSQPEFTALLEDDSLISYFVERACPLTNFGNIEPSKTYDADRLKRQSEIAQIASESGTVCVRAPAGFGKTVVGLLWASLNKQPVLWVTPRNIVAEAVYLTICKELEALGLNASIELHLTGERKESRGGAQEFGSDIIVTNIDTVLSPMVDNKTAARLFRILGSGMIFDEYHELVGESPLFAAFVTLMRARHRICGETTQTLLLSATPNCAASAWDVAGKETTHLPTSTSHYPPAHFGKYKVFWDGENDDRSSREGRLSIFNSVARSQQEFTSGSYAYLAHSKFIPADRQRIFSGILRDFGRGGTGVGEGRNVAAALVVQAAMDISFLHLDERICSPDFTLQRIGRIDRWGNLTHQEPSIRLGLDESPNDKAATRILYDQKLRTKWIEALRAAFPETRMTDLAELYDIYNRFHKDHHDGVLKFIIENYKEGMKSLIEYGPLKPRNPVPDSDEDDSKSRTKKSLRHSTPSWFFSVRRKSDHTWLGPDEIMSEGMELLNRFQKGMNEVQLVDASRMLMFIKELHSIGFKKFRRYLKGSRNFPNSTKRWFTLARCSDTPLPDFTRIYDQEYGLQEKP